MKTLEMRENRRKVSGVYLENYSYISCHLLQTSKLCTLAKPR